MIAPARVAAYEALRAIGGDRKAPGGRTAAARAPVDLPTAIARVRSGLDDERDRALAGEIVTGTLRWQGALDHTIGAFAKRTLAKLDPEVVDILRMAIFQLLHLTRVPASAAVDDAVSLTKRAGKKSAAPLVNAVLRRVSRERDRLPLPARAEQDRDAALDYLATTLSHPRWLAARWLDRYGFESAERWCLFNNTPPALTLRVNRLRSNPEQLIDELRRHGVSARRTSFAPDGLAIESGNPLLTPLASGGAFVVQDEASQLVALITGVRPGERVLDACASPGGKTTAMASAMGDQGFILAADVRPRRVRLLAETVRRSGAASVRVVQADANRLPVQPRFDCVLVDAPCSGLGTLRRDPDIKWRRREEDLALNAAMQIELLNRVGTCLVPGGRLIYSTCSSEPEENEMVVEQFLDAHPEFRRGPAPALPAEVRPLVDETGALRTVPHRDGLEAFFAATLVKASDLR
jgi:16S rRNA (cytosine967-C5)-methyltransferase